jgi:hypothetical protein
MIMFLLWLAPLALYAFTVLRRQKLPERPRGRLVLAALAGNILLLVGYARLTAALDDRERARIVAEGERCLREHLAEVCQTGPMITDPPTPPFHWEWALAAYAASCLGLYLLLHLLEQRMVRREDERSAEAPGSGPSSA